VAPDGGVENLVAAIGPGLWHQIAPESMTRLARCKLKLLRIRYVRLEMLAAIWECPVSVRLQHLAALSAMSEPPWRNRSGRFDPSDARAAEARRQIGFVAEFSG